MARIGRHGPSHGHFRQWVFVSMVFVLLTAAADALFGGLVLSVSGKASAWVRHNVVNRNAFPGSLSVHAGSVSVPRFVIPTSLSGVRQVDGEVGGWAWDNGGVPADVLEVNIAITGASADPVYLEDLSLRVLSREPPLRGIQLVASGGGGLYDRILSANLDRSDRPDFDLSSDTEDEDWQFPLWVNKDETEVLTVWARTSNCLCEFELVLHYRQGQDQRRTVLRKDDQGNPFRVTSTENAREGLDVDVYQDPAVVTPADAVRSSCGGVTTPNQVGVTVFVHGPASLSCQDGRNLARALPDAEGGLVRGDVDRWSCQPDPHADRTGNLAICVRGEDTIEVRREEREQVASAGPSTGTTGASPGSAGAPVPCPSIGFTPNSDDVAGQVSAINATCAEAHALVHEVERSVAGRTEPYSTASGFQCTRVPFDGDGLYGVEHECVRQATRISWFRS